MINKHFSELYKSKPQKGNELIKIEMDSKYNFISMVDRLANGDITKYEAVYQIEWVEALTTLEYYKAKDEYIEKLNKANEAKNKAKR
jgi:hypothetical protein